mmetsp:Transcript_28399/g.58966  ORF Transcript_28399/g.58966 Transcript_28399/m.58966 type:complete len:203 (-) Transcript_28399:356-964(-)
MPSAACGGGPLAFQSAMRHFPGRPLDQSWPLVGRSKHKSWPPPCETLTTTSGGWRPWSLATRGPMQALMSVPWRARCETRPIRLTGPETRCGLARVQWPLVLRMESGRFAMRPPGRLTSWPPTPRTLRILPRRCMTGAPLCAWRRTTRCTRLGHLRLRRSRHRWPPQRLLGRRERWRMRSGAPGRPLRNTRRPATARTLLWP